MNRHLQSLKLWQDIADPHCQACSLHEGTRRVCMLGDGPVPAEGMIIGEAPGVREEETGVTFSGKSGILLRQTLKDVGVDPRKLYMTTTVACKTPANRAPSRKEAKTCSALYLEKQIALVKPKVILLLGNVALQYVTIKKASVTKLEGSTLMFNGISCVPCRSPSSVVRLEGEDSYHFVFQKFKENLFIFKRELYPVEDEFKFEPYLPYDFEKGRPIYIDIETNGLNPYKPDSELQSIGLSQEMGKLYCAPIQKVDKGRFAYLLKNYQIMAHRGTFEGTWLRHHYGVTPRLYHDTKLCAYLQDENEPSGLKYQAVRYLHVEPWTESRDIQNPDYKKLLPYNARDVEYGLRLYRERDLPFLKANPKVARLMRYILLPAQEVFIEVMSNGYHIDMKAAKKKIKHCQAKKKELNDKLNEIAGKEVNPGSAPQMCKLLYGKLQLKCPVKTKGGKSGKPKDSTAEAALIRLRGQHPATDILWDWRGWEKYESTYLEPWIRQGPVLHARYDFTGTDTGRLSSSMTADFRGQKGLGAVIHQCPRDPFIRNLVVPRNPDWCIVATDVSQGELRFVAHAANEDTMIDIFNHDPHTPEGDIHFQTARELADAATEIDKETRKKAKAVNFGFVYGMWAKKFGAYALEKFDLKLTHRESEDYRNKFFRKYSGLERWHNRVEAFVRQNKWIDSVFGRRRHLPRVGEQYEEWVQRESVRQAINSPIQSACSDVLLLVMALIASYSLPWDFKINRKLVLPVGSAHDSGLFECHKSYAKELKEGIMWTVQNLPLKKFFNLELRVPLFMDVDVYKREWAGETMEI